MIRMVVAVRAQQRLNAHTKIAGSFPWIDASLHEPGRRGMTKRVRGHASREFRQLHRVFETGLYRPNTLAVEFNEMSSDQVQSLPAPHVCEQPLRQGNRRLPFIRLRFSLGEPIEYAAIQIYI